MDYWQHFLKLTMRKGHKARTIPWPARENMINTTHSLTPQQVEQLTTTPKTSETQQLHLQRQQQEQQNLNKFTHRSQMK